MNQPQSTKPGVMLYFEQLHSILDRGMTNTQIAAALAAIRNYSQYGEVPDFGDDTVLNILWDSLQPALDRDAKRYERITNQRVLASTNRWWKDYAAKNGIDPADNQAKQIWLESRQA